MSEFDLLIRGGRVVDGTGNPWLYADLGLIGDRIAMVDRHTRASARRIIDASGLVVAPGFIDAHCHSDVILLAEPRHEGRVRQGITTELLGQDGISYAPVSAQSLPFWQAYLAGVNGRPDLAWNWAAVAQFLDAFDGRVAVNVAYLVPHGNVRYEVMGTEPRVATDDELLRMQVLVTQAMEEGAVGLSTGLGMYVPARYADTRELVTLCHPVARAGGVFVSHMRDYDAHIDEALAEMFAVSTQADLPVHISHLVTRAETLRLLEQARREGVQVTYDVYPYLAGCTILGACLPSWVQDGSVSDAVHRLRQPQTRERLRREINQEELGQLQIAAVMTASNRSYEGAALQCAAKDAGKPLVDFIADILVEEQMAVTIVGFYTTLTEDDLKAFLCHRYGMISTDGVLLGSHPHPRGFGTYPRLLGRYVRESGTLSLEECIRKMTSLPAQLIGLKDRGLIREGYAADVVCFDSETVIDEATYDEGRRPPLGIPYVLVNGQVVIDNGVHTGILAGRALRKQPWQNPARSRQVGLTS